MTIPLDAWLPARLKLPTRMSGAKAKPRGCPRDIPIWHCSRWGLPCRSGYPSRGGLLPHRFTLTQASASGRMGGFISVALSVGSLRPGVTRHRGLVESGLSSNGCPPAAIQPSAHLSATRGRRRVQALTRCLPWRPSRP